MRAIDADRLLQVLEINFGHTGGAPMTDEAVDMVMERMEEMKNG